MKKNVVRILALVLVGLLCLSLLPMVAHGDWCQHEHCTTVRVDPVCGEDGYTAAVCMDCGEEFGLEIIPHTEEHDYSACVMNDDYLISEGDCLEPTLYFKSCSKCGHIAEAAYYEAIEQMTRDLWAQHEREVAFYGGEVSDWGAILGQRTAEIQDQYIFRVGGDGHHFYEVERQPATCLNDGWEAYRVCEYCGEVEGYEAIPAKGHRFGEFTVVKAPTCTEPGLQKHECEVCGEVEEESIPSLGHQGPFTPVKAPTCTEPGSEKRICTVCQAEEIREVPALGHQGPFTVTKEATCTEDGVQERDCTVCGAHETVPVPAAHKYGADGLCVFCGAENPDAQALSLSTSDTEVFGSSEFGSEDTETFDASPYHVELSLAGGASFKYTGVVLAGQTLVANLLDDSGDPVEVPENMKFYFIPKSGNSTDEQTVTMIPGNTYPVPETYIDGTVVCVFIDTTSNTEACRSDTLRVRKEISINVSTLGEGDMSFSYARLGDDAGETPRSVAFWPTTFLTGDELSFYVTPDIGQKYMFRRIASVVNNTITAMKTAYDAGSNTYSYTFTVRTSSPTNYLLQTDKVNLYNETKPTLGDDSNIYLSKEAEKALEALRKEIAGAYGVSPASDGPVRASVIRYVTPIWASDALALSKASIETAVAYDLLDPFTVAYPSGISYDSTRKDLVLAFHYNTASKTWQQISESQYSLTADGAEIHGYTDFSPFAVIGLQQVTLTLDPNGGQPDAPQTVQVVMGSTYTAPECSFTAPTPNEAFKNWRGSDGKEYDPGDTVPETGTLSGDFTLTAQWVEGHTVTFDSNSPSATGTMNPLFVASGDTKTLPEIGFVLYNHAFDGWSDTPTGDKLYDDQDPITPTEGITLYARWRRTHSSVYFDPNGGEGSMDEQRAALGGKITLNPNAFTYGDNLFSGWATVRGGDVVYRDGQTIDTPDTDLTLYAVWDYKVTVHFDPSSDKATGTGAMADQVVPGGRTFTLNANSFKAPNMFAFDGWNKVKSGGGVSVPDSGAYADGQEIEGGFSENTTLYAQWKRTAYTVTYLGNGGIGSMSTQTIPIKGAVAVSENRFTAPYGTAFVGWSTDSEADAPDPRYAPGQPIRADEMTDDLTLYAVWSDLIKIRFDPASDKATGTGAMADQEIVSGVQAVLNENKFQAPSGWAFTGWNDKQDGSGTGYEDKGNITATAGLTLYAQWQRVSYTVRYDANSGTGSMTSQTLPKDGAITVSENRFTAPANKAFVGWSKTSGLGNTADYQPGDAIQWADLTDDLTLYAVWDDLFTIHFNPASDLATGVGTMADQTLIKGREGNLNENKFQAPSGWEFTGWNDKQDGSGEKSYKDKAPITLTADLTLYAQWQRVFYNVSYSANGGSGSTAAQTVPKDGSVAAAANKFTAPVGKIFVGWSKTAGQDNPVDYKAGDAIRWTDLNVEPYADLTLYAVWKDKVVIHFSPESDSGTGTGTMADQEAPSGEKVNLNANAFTAPTGKAFGSWNTMADGTGDSYADRAEITLTANVTLYAQWLDDACTVTFDKNNDLVMGEQHKQSILKNTATALDSFSTMGFTVPKGIAFSSWNTKRDGTGSSFKDRATVRVTKDTTLYAQWINACTITFDKNSPEATGSMDPQVVETNVSTPLVANEFRRINYSFDGWSTNPDGTGEKYADQGSIRATDDVTLYAVWEQIAYAITYDANGGGGTQMAQQNVPIGNTATIRECAYNPKPGEVFAYWQEILRAEGEKADNGIYHPGDRIVPSRDLALEAVWREKLVISYYPGQGSGSYNEGEAPMDVDTEVKTAEEAGFTPPSGETFAYWQDDAGNRYYAGQKYQFHANTRLTAIWASSCTITFNSNGGTGSMPSQTAPSGVEVTLNSNRYTRSDYIFKYWTKTKSDPYPGKRPEEVTSSDVYKDGTGITVVQDLTLYAQWYKTAIARGSVMISGEVTGLDDFAVWGETLTAYVNDPVLKSGFNYSWMVDGVEVKSGPDNTYQVKQEDYGKTVICVVSHPQATNEVDSNTKIVGTYTEDEDLMIINRGDSNYPYSKYAYIYGVVPGTTYYKDGREYRVPASAADGVMEISVPGTYTFGYATYYIENWYTVGYDVDTSGSGTVTMKNGTVTLTSTTYTNDIRHLVNTVWLVREGSATDLNITMKPASSTYVHWSLNGGAYSSSSTEVSRRLGTITQPMFFTIVFNKSSSSPRTGDMSHLGVWSALCFSSLVGAASLIGSSRRRKKNRG